MVVAKEYSHNKILLFGKNRGGNALFTSEYHGPPPRVYSRHTDVVVEGVSYWAKLAALFCFESTSLIYRFPQPHVRWAVRYISFLGVVFIVIVHFLL